MLDPGKLFKENYILKSNTYETHDSFFTMDWVTSWEGSFFDIFQNIKFIVPRDQSWPATHKDLLMACKFSKTNLLTKNERSVYNLINFIGDIGGVVDVILVAIGIFINPFQEHSLTITALKKLFLVKTKMKSPFVPDLKEMIIEKKKERLKLKGRISTLAGRGSDVPESLKNTIYGIESCYHR